MFATRWKLALLAALGRHSSAMGGKLSPAAVAIRPALTGPIQLLPMEQRGAAAPKNNNPN